MSMEQQIKAPNPIAFNPVRRTGRRIYIISNIFTSAQERRHDGEEEAENPLHPSHLMHMPRQSTLEVWATIAADVYSCSHPDYDA